MFVVIEGPNGVGKSAVATAVRDHLIASGQAAVLTGEPTRTGLGGFVRQAEAQVSPLALALLVAADRAEHLATVVDPAVAAGQHVICDRYIPSSLVLQQLDGLDVNWVREINRPFRQSDLLVVLDLPVETLDRRLAERSSLTRLEGRSAAERQLYEEIARLLEGEGWRVLRFNCLDRSLGDLAEAVCAAMASGFEIEVGPTS